MLQIVQQYSADLDKALGMGKKGHTGYRAAKDCGIPQSTLRDRVKNGDRKKRGRKLILTMRDENQLVNYANFMPRAGNPVTSKWLMGTAGRLAKSR